MTDSSASRKHAAARPGAKKPASRGAARPGAKAGRQAADAAAAQVPKTPEDMLRAGLKAFRLDRFMGWMPPAGEKTGHGLALSGLDPFGFRKFEDVFDQRVAGALEHLGWPDAQALRAMREEIDALRAEVERLRAPAAKPAPSRAAPARKASSGTRRTRQA